MIGCPENKAVIDPELGDKLDTKALRRAVTTISDKFSKRWNLQTKGFGWSSTPDAQEKVTRAEFLEAWATLITMIERASDQ